MTPLAAALAAWLWLAGTVLVARHFGRLADPRRGRILSRSEVEDAVVRRRRERIDRAFYADCARYIERVTGRPPPARPSNWV